MTREEIEKTQWARKFKEENPSSYEDAIGFVMDPNLKVDIYQSNEAWESKYHWIINVAEPEPLTPEDEFWLDAYENKKDAITLCKKMGWKIKRHYKQR